MIGNIRCAEYAESPISIAVTSNPRRCKFSDCRPVPAPISRMREPRGKNGTMRSSSASLITSSCLKQNIDDVIHRHQYGPTTPEPICLVDTVQGDLREAFIARHLACFS